MFSKINSAGANASLGYVPALDGLRAIAVTMVMFLHAHFFLGKNGAIGVDIFFTLSGFLITTLLLEEFQKKGTIEILSFYFRRTLRLFPALYLMLLFVLIYALITNNVEDKHSLFKEITASALYINNVVYGIGWWKGYAPIALAHTWSLHKPVFVGFQKLSTIYNWAPSTTFVLKFVATFLIAILSWELMEKKIVQWGRAFLKKRQAAKE